MEKSTSILPSSKGKIEPLIHQNLLLYSAKNLHQNPKGNSTNLLVFLGILRLAFELLLDLVKLFFRALA